MLKTGINDIDILVASIALKGLDIAEQDEEECDKNISLISKYMFDFDYTIDFKNKGLLIHFENNLKERIFNELNYDKEYKVEALEDLFVPLDLPFSLCDEDLEMIVYNVFNAYSYCSTEFVSNIYGTSKYSTNFLDLSAVIRVIKDICCNIEMYIKEPKENGVILLRKAEENFVEIDFKYLKNSNKPFVDMNDIDNIISTNNIICTEKILSSLLCFNKCTKYKYEINMNSTIKLIASIFDILSVLDESENDSLEDNIIR